jgi:hypothetical protein
MSVNMRRQRRLAGRHALVDGVSFTMPVNSEHTPALMAAFSVDGAAAAALLPGGEVHPVLLPSGRGVLVITVVDYRETDIGRYIEFSIALACSHGSATAPPLLPALLQGHYGTGQYVLDLPVSTEVSVKGGKGIWGMPKHQANLDFVESGRQVASQYDCDGLLGLRIEIDRPRTPALPLSVAATNYCAFRGMLMKSCVSFKAKGHFGIGPFASARLYLGDSPHTAALHTLDISGRALFTAWMPETHGVLDDHLESWFITEEQPITAPTDGLESVVNLGFSQVWLDPPKAPYGAPVPPRSA